MDCSGLMYCGVPRVMPVSVRRSWRSSPAASALAMPKSAISAWPPDRRMFSGLMSRWITLVSAVEAVGHLAGDADGVAHGQLALAREPVPQRLALHEGHGEPEPLLAAGRGADGPGIEHRENVGMVQPGTEPDLLEEPGGAQRRGQVGVHDLERDRPVVLEVAGEVDGGHAAAPQLALDRVAVGESRPERFKHSPP